MSTPVTLDAASIAAISEAMNGNIDKKFDSMKSELGQTFLNFDTSLRKGMVDMVAPLTKRQDEFEEKNDVRLRNIEDQISDLHKLVKNPPQSLFPALPSGNNLPSHPTPPESSTPNLSGKVANPNEATLNLSESDRNTLRNAVLRASTIIGVGPVTPEMIDSYDARSRDDSLKMAGIDFLRNELGVKESEINNDDVLKAFPPFGKAASHVHIYIQLTKKVDADWCRHLGRTVLKNKPGFVFLYIPKQLHPRFEVLDKIAYKKRKFEGFKTQYQLTDLDVVLLVSPKDQFNYIPLHVPDLPPADMAPARTPPRGRTFSKRRRSPSQSPDENSKKTDRKVTPTKPSVDSPADTATDTDIEVASDGKEESGGNLPSAPLPYDFGSVNSVEASSPLTGKVLLEYGLANGAERRHSLNF